MKLSNGMHSLNACKQRVKVIKQFLTEREEILGEGSELATLLARPVQRVAQYTNVVQYLIVNGSPGMRHHLRLRSPTLHPRRRKDDGLSVTVCAEC